MLTDYETQAESFLKECGLVLLPGSPSLECPPWVGDISNLKRDKYACNKCGGIHGWKYNVTILETAVRPDGKMAHVRTLEFPFWNSYADTHFMSPKVMADPHGRKLMPGEHISVVRDASGRTIKHWGKALAEWYGKPPTAYDVLACISLDVRCPASFEDFCADYGYDTDSRKAESLHRRCVEFALRLRQFFTSGELAELQDIQ